MISVGSGGQDAGRGTLEATMGYNDRRGYHWLEEAVKSLHTESMMVESLQPVVM